MEACVVNKEKLPWFIDLLNINLNNTDLKLAQQRIQVYLQRFRAKKIRITENLDFESIIQEN